MRIMTEFQKRSIVLFKYCPSVENTRMDSSRPLKILL